MTLNFGVYGKLRSDENKEIVNSLDTHPSVDAVFYHSTMAEQLDRKGYSLDEIEEKDLDFIMTIGGDGTILRLLQKTHMNVLGINTGRVGFLTSAEIHELDKALNMVDNDEYFIDERIKLKVIINGEVKAECTNEAVVHTDQVAKMRSFVIKFENNEIDRFRADGLIVSTPTGSTCYSMSAGGPIIDPRVDAFVIVPISPYKLATKPYVVPVDKKIQAELTEEDKTCQLVLDGQRELTIGHDDKLEFTLAENKARFISFEKDFYSRIRKKLVWK